MSRLQGDDMHGIDAVIWGIFMSATMEAAVHLRQDHQEHLRTTKISNIQRVKHSLTFRRNRC